MTTTTELVLVVILVIAVGIPATYLQVRRARRTESERDRLLWGARQPGQRVWDSDAAEWVELPPGTSLAPGQLPEDEVAEIRELRLLFEAPAYEGSDLDASLDRFRQAIRDEQQNGDPA
ncbi:hypothetical protein [Streptomyces canus]|uniref:hypothetical protein n=1 Tax=Streptomyces canus TaxID=58343 RepID=UPI000371F5FB|nr:hypothetical protein [Streptomyces canus]